MKVNKEQEKTTNTGIVIQTNNDRVENGEVLAAGPQCEFKEGNKIYFPSYALEEIQVGDGEVVDFVNEEYVIGYE